MFNYRFVPYLIVVGIVVFLSVCYMGYREYQKNVEFETFMTKVQATLDKDTNPPEHTEANPQGTDTNSSATTSWRLSNIPHLIDTLASPVKVTVVPDDQESVPIDESEISPEILAQMPDPDAPMIPLRIQTPDGNIRVISVPAGLDYNKVDIGVSESIANRPAFDPSWALTGPMKVRKSEIPEGETAESYLYKKRWALAFGVPIEEVERMMESGHIRPREVIARSPVEEFIDHDHLFHSHGHDDRSRRGGKVGDAQEHQAKGPVSGGRFSEDTQHASIRSVVPVSPSNLKPTPPPQSMADLEKQLTPQGTEAELSEGLSSERFNNAQQLIDQYGTEEGLRRLRESDPEAARQFESDKSRPGRERRPVPSRDAPDGGQSESESKD